MKVKNLNCCVLFHHHCIFFRKILHQFRLTRFLLKKIITGIRYLNKKSMFQISACPACNMSLGTIDKWWTSTLCILFHHHCIFFRKILHQFSQNLFWTKLLFVIWIKKSMFQISACNISFGTIDKWWTSTLCRINHSEIHISLTAYITHHIIQWVPLLSRAWAPLPRQHSFSYQELPLSHFILSWFKYDFKTWNMPTLTCLDSCRLRILSWILGFQYCK
jgi:hypothetical protein